MNDEFPTAGNLPPPLPPQTPLYAQQTPPQPIPPRVTWASSCLRGCMGASFAFVLIGLLMLVLIARIGCSTVESVKDGIKTATITHKATNIAGKDKENSPKVLEISITGMIQDDVSPTSWFEEPGSSQTALRKIRAAKDDSTIRGILLHLNSGGGGITASDVLWNSLREFKQADTNRIIVAMMGSIAASGAYYIAAAADCIVANPTTMTGSIGVILNSYNVQDLATKIGLKSVTIKSGGNKDILNPFKTLTPEQEQMLQRMVDAMHTRFVNIVAEGRHLDEAHVRAIADGRILLAAEALELGLINKIGYIDDAKAELTRLLGSKPSYINPDEQPGFLRLIRSPAFWGESFSRAAATIRERTTGESQLRLESHH